MTQVQSIIDVGERPALKEQLLRGELNVVRCPFCGTGGMLSTPLLYHDPAHEMALVFMPMEANLKREDQERLIGALTNTLMDSLPSERRRGYMLQPRTVFTMDGMIENILQADGITPAMIAAQREQIQLIQNLLDLVDDDARLKTALDEHKAQLDYEFFLLLTTALEAAQQRGDQKAADRLSRLREKLLALTGTSPLSQVEPLPRDANYQQLIEAFMAAPANVLPDLVAANRDRLDYGFFRTLTDQLESAETAKEKARAEQLRELRNRILAIVDEMDQQARTALEKGARLLEAILQSDNPQQTIRERLNEVDEATLVILQANIAEAHRQNQAQVAEILEGIYGYILNQLEEQMPPELRLVNRLLRVDSREARQKILDQAPEVKRTALLGMLKQIEADAQQYGETALVDRVREVYAQIDVKVEVPR